MINFHTAQLYPRLIALALFFLALFLWLTYQVDSRSYFALDYKIMDIVKSFSSPITITLLAIISWPGYTPQVFIITGGILSLLFLSKKRLESIIGFISFSTVSLVVYYTKIYISRFRPDAHIYIYSGADRSFPSGHVVSYTIVLGFILYLSSLRYQNPLVKLFHLLVFTILIFITGISRIYLGYHWPTDVVGGLFLGLFWLSMTIFFHKLKSHYNTLCS